jgi:hypothetical protein
MFQSQLEEVEVRIIRMAKRGRGTGNHATVAKPLKFDRTTSWAMFQRQSKTVEEHNCWTRQEKSIRLITALQGRATGVLHRILKGATYDETPHALEDYFGDTRFAPTYHCQFKTRN